MKTEIIVNTSSKSAVIVLVNKVLMIRFLILLMSLTQISWTNMSDGEKALANFTKKFNQEIFKEYGFSLFGSGASFPVKIEDIILSYKADHCETLDGARKLAVEIAHKMIKRMNEDENLLKYLSSNPASIKHVDLRMLFTGSKPGLLHSVMVIGIRNKVVYNTENADRSMLIDLYEETFEEAEHIVKQQPLEKLKNDPSNDK